MQSSTTLAIALTFAVTLPGWCGDWSPRLAADYLDSRQREWAAWPPAKATGGTCVSCHTGATYLLARPALRRALGETQPTAYETGLLDGLRARVEMTDANKLSPAVRKEPRASEAVGVESIFAALFLASQDAGKSTLSPEAEKAFDRMWSLQKPGGWAWFSLNLDPWEMPQSQFYGATLAALATAAAPVEYRNRTNVKEHLATLTAYLEREQRGQPMHNRLMALWASAKLPEALSSPVRHEIIDELWRSQQVDGGWTTMSLGPWAKHETAPASKGSDSYATALVAFILQQSGVRCDDKRLHRALDWLRAHQDRQSGSWAADSMNKVYPPDSMQVKFMRDAATSFAVLALLESGL